jgi:hypothetical protein
MRMIRENAGNSFGLQMKQKSPKGLFTGESTTTLRGMEKENFIGLIRIISMVRFRSR